MVTNFMPYYPSTECQKPEDPLTKIFRYRTIERFEQILKSNCLFFSTLKTQGDQKEGYINWPEINNEFQSTILSANENSSIKTNKKMEEVFNKRREILLINCWCMYDTDQFLLWKAYAPCNGVAIQSTIGRLCDSFKNYDNVVHICKVKYVEHNKNEYVKKSDKGTSLEISSLEPALHKSKQYESERELRVIINPGKFICKGMNVPVDLHTLIESIHIPSNSSEGHKNYVRLLLERYGLGDKIVYESALNDKSLKLP